MVSFIHQLRGEGAALDDAVIRGSLTRLRPVLMTALVAALGFLRWPSRPAPARRSSGRWRTVVIGGVISSTLLTLVVLPALYRLFAAKDERGPEPGEAPDDVT
jgi:cobalt-zinc-cadmium resistance protein CzcA